MWFIILVDYIQGGKTLMITFLLLSIYKRVNPKLIKKKDLKYKKKINNFFFRKSSRNVIELDYEWVLKSFHKH